MLIKRVICLLVLPQIGQLISHPAFFFASSFLGNMLNLDAGTIKRKIDSNEYDDETIQEAQENKRSKQPPPLHTHTILHCPPVLTFSPTNAFSSQSIIFYDRSYH
jgi:hypothetical protein